jgi:hypothetical protein
MKNVDTYTFELESFKVQTINKEWVLGFLFIIFLKQPLQLGFIFSILWFQKFDEIFKILKF